MSQSTEKRARRAWRDRMKSIAGSDWEKAVTDIKDLKLTLEGYEVADKRQRVAIIILSVLCAILAAAALWGWL